MPWYLMARGPRLPIGTAIGGGLFSRAGLISELSRLNNLPGEIVMRTLKPLESRETQQMLKRCRELTSVFLAMLVVCASPGFAIAQNKSQQQALNMIADFADRICKDIPTTGKEENLDLSGKGKAEVDALLKKMASLGIEGAIKFQKSEYQGLLRTDLVNALKNSADCKLKVFESLNKKLIPEAGASKGGAINNQGDGNVIIQGNGNAVGRK